MVSPTVKVCFNFLLAVDLRLGFTLRFGKGIDLRRARDEQYTLQKSKPRISRTFTRSCPSSSR